MTWSVTIETIPGIRADASPGDGVGPGDVMDGGAYNHPMFGISDVLGGSFVGMGRFFAACSAPNKS